MTCNYFYRNIKDLAGFKNLRGLIIVTIIITSLFIILSCKKDNKPTDDKLKNNTGKIVFKFEHLIDGKSFDIGVLKYTNAASNIYSVSDVMYFISDVTLHKSDGTIKVINKWNDIYYVDINIASTLTWYVYDSIPEGQYDSISFTFGINKAKNITALFVNAPEVNMSWPQVLGGGYHYLMINGKWKDNSGATNNYNFHLGIGQLYKGSTANVDSIYGYVQNYFNVNLPSSAFSMTADNTKEVQIIMNIEKWFKYPNVFDLNIYGFNTMQNQKAMQMMKENGKNVFSIGSIK